MEEFFEVLKYTLPSCIVFLTVYFLLKEYFEQERLKMAQQRAKEYAQNSLPIKIQAYERLALFMERIRIQNLMLRFPFTESSSKDICRTLMLGVQQEYEHNLVQQIYVSDKLWEIILLAKNELLHELEQSIVDFEHQEPQKLKQHLLTEVNKNSSRVIDAALDGIRSEMRLLI